MERWSDLILRCSFALDVATLEIDCHRAAHPRSLVAAAAAGLVIDYDEGQQGPSASCTGDEELDSLHHLERAIRGVSVSLCDLSHRGSLFPSFAVLILPWVIDPQVNIDTVVF